VLRVAVSTKDLIQALSERQLAMERQLSELAVTLKALQARVAELSQPAVLQPASAPAVEAKAAPAAAKEALHQETGEVTSEMLVVIAAAVTAFLGKKVRIRSAKMLQSPYEVVNPWSQQGRVYVQASHILRSRG
jgi:methylmalonyl-CoA carboxyltransferase large subunit